MRVVTYGSAVTAIDSAIAESLTFEVSPAPSGGVMVVIDAEGFQAVCIDREVDADDFASMFSVGDLLDR
jgi:hypothetical protein